MNHDTTEQGQPLLVYSRGGKVAGQVRGQRCCRLESCSGTQLCVLWPNGNRTWPCTKGMFVREDGHWQILD